ncbi:MAG TPA: NDP-sugar synthase [Pyrinomonadaceae bacterium]|jgi:NDP-sugar pyrophosphorylase family protein
MQALILAGGEGTRLRPLTANTPKPIVPIGNEPFLFRQIEALKNAGVTDITLSTGYQPLAIEKALGNGASYGVHLRYLVEPKPLGTAGAYKFAEQFLETTTIVLNGDILTDIDLSAVARQHKKHSAAATIVLTEVENPSAYGLVEVGENEQVLRFLEKPKPDEISRININTINAGIYILEPEVLNCIPENENYSFEYGVFPGLLERQANFRAFVARDAYWLDIGTPERYLQAHRDLITGKIRSFKVNRAGNFNRSANAEIDDKSCIADGCIIKQNAKIINSVLGRDVVIEENAVIQNSVIWSGTRINSYTNVLGSIIGKDCHIGSNVVLAHGSVLGDKTSIANFTNY